MKFDLIDDEIKTKKYFFSSTTDEGFYEKFFQLFLDNFFKLNFINFYINKNFFFLQYYFFYFFFKQLKITIKIKQGERRKKMESSDTTYR
jgi:hypothetical protein